MCRNWQLHNMKFKPVAASLLPRTWQPVTPVAGETRVPSGKLLARLGWWLPLSTWPLNSDRTQEQSINQPMNRLEGSAVVHAGLGNQLTNKPEVEL